MRELNMKEYLKVKDNMPIPSARRVSELADMLVYHITYRRTQKALLIAQYLRWVHGSVINFNMNVRTGHRESAF